MRLGETDYRHPAAHCPECNYKIDAATPIDADRGPIPGDYTVCLKCASFLVFGNSPALRLITHQEIADMDAETRGQLVKVRAAIKRLNQSGRGVK